MRNLDIDLLRVFVAIVEENSLTGAGRRLFRTQSTVSLQLKRLESMVNERLVERKQGRVLGLTAAGERLLGHARRIVRANDDATAELGAPKLEGIVRLGVPDETAHTRLSRGLAAFRARYPRVRLEVICRLSGELDGLLDAGQIDLALINRLGPDPRTEPLRSERLTWVASTTLSWSPGEPVPLVGFPHGCAFRARALESLEKAGLEWFEVYSSTSYYGVWSAVSAGLGLAALGPAQPFASSTDSFYTPALPAPGRIEVGLVTGPKGDTETVASLRDHIRTWFQEPAAMGQGILAH
ncbi:LysR substrate-binding domain-containing protein [Telmatospirillum sp. J64-1]|uniref:LysR substrate-binding domain-containing protein n=1 Tax=Telmatospirillum sp. J64-1 TaxID=2502183 RepID=UPI00163D7CD8|nr:LysR substrate-binding domain-containing protein [Telmatospirillum sp. J64-1]